MATSKTLELSIKIAGRMDKSLTAAINGTQSKIGSLTKSISNIGTVGLATMGAVATAAAVGIADCTKEAQALESAMAPVVRYVDGLADASGAVSDAIADNGKTFKQNYGALKTYIQDLSTEIPRTTDQLTAMSAALGQSGIGVDKQLTTGYLRDTAVSATAMDLDDQTAGNYVAKWEASFNFDHKQVMELMDQINYLGAHNATTAAEIAQSVNSAASMGQIAGVDPAATAAMATAMQATGVTTDRVGTSISRIYTNLSKGSNATKAQKEMWEELGFTAEGIAKSMQTDGVGTLKEVFTALQDMPDERNRDLCDGHGQADHTGCICLYHGYSAAHYFADLYGGSADDSQHNYKPWQCGYDGYADHWQRHSSGNADHTGHYYRDYDHWQRGCARTAGRV